MKNKLWHWIRKKCIKHAPIDCLLPWWLLVIKIILFPLDSFYWHMSKSRGYQVMSDSWIIDGVVYPSLELQRILEMHNNVGHYNININIANTDDVSHLYPTSQAAEAEFIAAVKNAGRPKEFR